MGEEQGESLGSKPGKKKGVIASFKGRRNPEDAGCEGLPLNLGIIRGLLEPSHSGLCMDIRLEWAEE